MLKPIVGGRIRAMTWKNDHGGLDKLGIIPSARGIQFVKRDEQGKLAGLFVAYTYKPTMFGGRSVRLLAFGVGSGLSVPRWMGRSRPSLPRCAGQLTNACEVSMRGVRTRWVDFNASSGVPFAIEDLNFWPTGSPVRHPGSRLAHGCPWALIRQAVGAVRVEW